MNGGLARLADFLITAALAGIEREALVHDVRTMESEGATPDQITDALEAKRIASETEAQDKIDKAT
ncbi:MAG: hypothetical protein OEW90_04995 [Betaproteobacteria bacterium]|nr:hypothetical protein [Betaproteobacteria bacterium]MDH4323476.1 hypothetical protein [Betaproteobacteria bacterium]